MIPAGTNDFRMRWQPDGAWRDPWVLADPDGDGWHMLVTARACDGPADQRGVIGHARSHDLVHWQAQPPADRRPGEGFGYLEVPQVEVVGGRPVLVFSCLGAWPLRPAPESRDARGNLVPAMRLTARALRR